MFQSKIFHTTVICLILAAGCLIADVRADEVELQDLKIRTLVPATKEFPRNMGADIVELKDGRLLLAYSQWIGGAHDNDDSQVMGMISSDKGQNWGKAFPIVPKSQRYPSSRMPSFLRLDDGTLVMFVRCRAGEITESGLYMLRCSDEAAGEPDESAWSEPVRITPPGPGRHIALNNRAIRLSTGRLLVPLSSPWPWDRPDTRGIDIRCWALFSDDDGATWKQSESMLAGPKRGLMEPYVVEINDKRVLMLMRTQMDRQYRSMSEDGGDTWLPAVAAPDLVSPESPVAIRRDPATGWLAVVWNHGHKGAHVRDRNPLTIAFSRDEGESWFGFIDLEPDRTKGYSYPSLNFIGGRTYVTYYEHVGGRLSLKLATFVVRPQ